MLTKDDLTITKKPLTDKDKEQDDLPRYMTHIRNISEEDKTRIIDEILEEFEDMKKTREDEGLEHQWDERENQYDGKVDENVDQQFNLHRPVTKIKCDAAERAIRSAFFESDPIYSISPRPEFDRVLNGREVCADQEDFLDYKIDETVPLKDPMALVVHSAVVKGTGILKIPYVIKKERAKREEKYKGNPITRNDPMTGQEVIVSNEGLEDFLANYPDAIEKYPGYVRQLEEGKEINLVVEYTQVTYNDPRPTYVDLKNFYCRSSCEGYIGLVESRLVVERINYSWWDLKKMEKEGKFYGIDELIYANDDDKKEGKVKKGYKKDDYDVLECVFHVKLKESDEEETKCVFWIAEDRKKMIGSIYYPYFSVPCYYVPFHIKKKKVGFYQPGMADDLKDSNIAENAILNFTLEGAWSSNTVTPIVEPGSDIEKQFLNKEWMHGIPLSAKQGSVDFLNKYMRPTNVGEMLNLLQYLIQGDDDVTGISSLLTGRESPVDPTAPAAKTLALLERSGVNVKDYILAMLSSFNMIAQIFLQLYYQHSQEGLQYKPRPERVVGEDPFRTIPRAHMAARTNIQSQALSFNFAKHNEKREDAALFQMLRQEPMIARNPESVYNLLKSIIRSWSPKWKNRVEKVLPRLEDFRQMQKMKIVEGIATYVQGVLQESKMTGQPPQFDPKQLEAIAMQMLSEVVNPTKEEAEAMKKK